MEGSGKERDLRDALTGAGLRKVGGDGSPPRYRGVLEGPSVRPPTAFCVVGSGRKGRKGVWGPL